MRGSHAGRAGRAGCAALIAVATSPAAVPAQSPSPPPSAAATPAEPRPKLSEVKPMGEDKKNGFKIAGFCGLKDYKGGKLEPARTAPSSGSCPRSR
jgi:hypothetical protein